MLKLKPVVVSTPKRARFGKRVEFRRLRRVEACECKTVLEACLAFTKLHQQPLQRRSVPRPVRPKPVSDSCQRQLLCAALRLEQCRTVNHPSQCLEISQGLNRVILRRQPLQAVRRPKYLENFPGFEAWDLDIAR
jgi:hypothetical protein